MTPQATAKKKLMLYALLGLGFAGLIGAHEWAKASSPQDASGLLGPFVLAVLGTLCFVAAGIIARRLLKEGRY
jgi:ABC-type Na+ efflux pump permease subunit